MSTAPRVLDAHVRETLDLAKERILKGAHLVVTVWDSNRNGDRHRVTVDLFAQNRTLGQVTHLALTHAVIEAGMLDGARPNRAHGNRHMAVFQGGGTPVAANVVAMLERLLGLQSGAITNWHQA